MHRGVTFLTLALPKCVHLPNLRPVSLMTKIYGLLQLIIICTFTCAISIDRYSPFNTSYSFIIFSLLIDAVILLLNCLNTLSLHFLCLRHYFHYLNIIWTFT